MESGWIRLPYFMVLGERSLDLLDPVGDGDHVRGAGVAPVTLVEYGEFECPACGRAYHLIRQIIEDLPDQVRFVFRHFARDDVHPFSERSAQAAEAAGAQGRFWEMHDFLFERQHQLEYEDLLVHAAELELDVDRFGKEILSGEHLARVQADLGSGITAGVTTTPAFFIDGKRYTGSIDRPGLIEAIKART